MDLDTLVSSGLQVSCLLAVAAHIWLLKHPRLRRHRFRRWIVAAATLGLVSFIASTFFVWGTFVTVRHPTLIDGRPVERQ
jgi:hypothetical protein